MICFPIINWNYRYQRPQHILKHFSTNGHRVFYLTTTPRTLKKPFEIKPIENNIYEIELNSPGYFDIYKDKFDESLVLSLIKSFEIMKKELKLDPICLVQFPTWSPFVIQLKKKFGFKIVFDVLDDFHNFPNVIKERKNEEELLVKNSDLIIVTSSSLLSRVKNSKTKTLFLPNAGEYNHFSKLTTNDVLKYKKPIVGYFGSIAEWFDTDLIEFLAKKRPDTTFVFIGHTFGSDIRKLRELENVHFLGERPYLELPRYLQSFDVCLIPFKILPLTQATHPIKIYEYFAQGKPVVVTQMPELSSMSEMCYIAQDKEDFLKKLNDAIQEKNVELKEKRKQFASKNTWSARYDTLITELKKIPSLDLFTHS